MIDLSYKGMRETLAHVADDPSHSLMITLAGMRVRICVERVHVSERLPRLARFIVSAARRAASGSIEFRMRHVQSPSGLDDHVVIGFGDADTGIEMPCEVMSIAALAPATITLPTLVSDDASSETVALRRIVL